MIDVGKKKEEKKIVDGKKGWRHWDGVRDGLPTREQIERSGSATAWASHATC